MRGWVYVMSNPAMPGYLKVGRTTDHYRTRAAQLHTTGVPAAFKVEYAIEVGRCDQLERLAHSYLRGHRISRNREFFTVSLGEAVQTLERCLTELELTPLDTLDPNQQRAEARRVEKKRTAAELDRERKRRIEAEAETLIALAKKPLDAAVKRTERILQISWAALCVGVTLMAHLSLGQLPIWGWVVALLAYFFGRIIPMLASVLLVDKMPWGRGVMEQQEAHIAAIKNRRDQALKSPVVDTIISS